MLTLVLDHQRAVHRAQLLEHLGSTNPLVQQQLFLLRRFLAMRGMMRGEGDQQALEILSRQVDLQAALLAFGDVFHVVALVFLLAIPLVFLLGRPEPARSGPGA